MLLRSRGACFPLNTKSHDLLKLRARLAAELLGEVRNGYREDSAA